MSQRKVIRQLRREGFTVLTRRQWGSRHLALYQWRRASRRFVGPADHAFAHITVTRDTGNAKADAQTIERIGMERFGSGWSYNWGIHRSSKTIILGQHMGAAGAHTLNDKGVPGFPDNLNYWGHAIAFIGMPGDPFDAWCRSAVAAIIRAEKRHGDMKPGARLYPHSKFAWKDCPCDPYRNSIPDIEQTASAPPPKPPKRIAARLIAANLRHDAPGYQRRIAELKDLRPSAAFLNECWQLGDDLSEAFPNATIVGSDETRAQSDVKLLIPAGSEFEVVKTGFKKLSKGVDAPNRIGQARFAAWARVKWNGRKYLLVAVHFNAAVQDKDGGPREGLRRVFQYQRSVAALGALLVANRGWKPVIGGDVNWRERPGYLDWYFAPDRLFKRWKLRVFAHHLDRIAKARELDSADQFTYQAKNADHRWLVEDVEQSK